MYINCSKVSTVLLISLTLAAGCASAPSDPLSGASSETLSDTPTTATSQETVAAATPNPGTGANPCASAAALDPVETPGTTPVETATAVQAVSYFVDDNGLAIRGTDPVAYFTQGGPVAGRSEFTHSWNDATWRFASAENRDLFAANPDQYAPQYGGFCAWAVSQGYTAAIDPNAWSIVDGKLYLNFNQGVQRRWERDIPGNIRQANANWPGVLTEL